MNKKLMAVAVAGAFGAVGASSVALAQSSTVTISGNLNYIWGQYQNGGNGLNAPNVTTGVQTASTNTKLKYDAMNDSESELVVAGTEALGGGLSAYFTCASSMDVTGTRGANGSGGLCGRNSAIGLKGGFGNAYIGNYDTPAKLVMNNYRVFALSYPMGLGNLFNGASADLQNATAASNASQFANVGGGASMSRRQQRLFTYISPEWMGLTGMAAMSSANEASGYSMGSGIQKPRLYSFGANYVNGPLKIGVGYEIHKDYNPGALSLTNVAGTGNLAGTYSGGTDTSLQLAAGYSFLNNAVVINAIYVKLNYQINGNLTTNQTNWSLNGSWNIAGPHTVRLGYVNVGDTGGNYGAVNSINSPGFGALNGPAAVGQTLANGGAGNTGANKYVFEYAYALSKRTEASFGYARINNDSQANYSIGTGSTGANFGESQTYYGLRINHKF